PFLECVHRQECGDATERDGDEEQEGRCRQGAFFNDVETRDISVFCLRILFRFLSLFVPDVKRKHECDEPEYPTDGKEHRERYMVCQKESEGGTKGEGDVTA